jgi:hypothetical protein
MGNLDSLKQILLNMNYDSKVTLSENKKILEQNLILENYNVVKWCTPASFELEKSWLNRTLAKGTCFIPKTDSGENAWAVAIPSTPNIPYVFDCSEKHGHYLFSNEEGTSTDMSVKGPNFTTGSIIKFVESDQNDDTNSRLITPLVKHFCLPLDKKTPGTGNKKTVSGTPKTETEVYKKGTKYVKDNFSGCLNSFPEVQTDKDGIPQYKFGDNWVWYSSNLNKLVLSDSKWAYIRDVKDCNDELFKTEEKKDKVDTGSKPEQQTKTKPETKQNPQPKPKPKPDYVPGGGSKKETSETTTCDGTYTWGCISPKIGEVQQCLKDQGLYTKGIDNKFGDGTLEALRKKTNKNYFTDSDIPTICGRKQEERKSDPGSTPGGGSKKEEEYVWNGTEI